MIRDFTPDDREAVLALLIDFEEYERAMEPEYYLPGIELAPRYLDNLLESAAFNGRLLVAEEAGAVLGYIAFWQEDIAFYTIPSCVNVCDLYVAPAARGQGLGRKLLAEAERFAAERGIKMVYLKVLNKNGTARAMYDKCGYRELETTMVKNIA